VTADYFIEQTAMRSPQWWSILPACAPTLIVAGFSGSPRRWRGAVRDDV
jgi:hypothetical protein